MGGVWNNAANWSNGVPGAGTNAFIDNGSAQASAVTLNIANAQVLNLTIDSDDSLGLSNGNSLEVNGSSINNAGTMTLNSTGSFTELELNAANVTLSGGGTLTMSNNVNNYIFGAAGTDTLTNQETIQGAGQIGHGRMTLVNSGTINANQAAGITIWTSGTTTNTGTIEATGGTLQFYGTTVNNAGGKITDAGQKLQVTGSTINGGTVTLTGASTLQLANGTIHGGTLTNSATGTIEVSANFYGTLGGTITNPAGGIVKVDNGANLTLENGAYPNLGTVQLNSTGGVTALEVGGANVTLSGGSVTLSSAGQNYIFGALGTDTLTNQETIQGAGFIGHGRMTLVNSGVINANQAAGMTIQTSGSFTNTGTLQVGSGITMHVLGGPFASFNSGTRTLTAGTYNVSGTLEIDQLGLTGGEIKTNAGNIVLNGAASSFVDGGKKDALANLAVDTTGSSFGITGGRNFTTVGNFTNNGTLTVGSGSKFTVNGNLTNQSGTTLSGGAYNITGTLQYNGANIVADASNITLNGASSQIINQTSGNGLANLASIAASSSFAINNGRNFTTAGNFGNNGTLTVGSGSTFKVNGNLSNQSGSTLNGGTYNVTGTLQYNGANIVTNTANITLTGNAAKIINQTSVNALANLATNTSTGKFTVTGGQALSDSAAALSNAGSLTVGKSSSLTLGGPTTAYKQTGGTTTVDGTLTAGAITISGGSVFGNGGTFSGNTSLTGGAFNIGDALKTAGKESITGTYTQSAAGALNIDIGGTTVGTKFDQLTISGAASLNGILNLGLVNPFVPTVGETFDILNASSVAGKFSTVNGTAINGSEHFTVMYNGNNVTLDVVSGAALSNSLLARSSSSPTPEPGTLLLLGTGLVSLAGFARHRRRNPQQEG